MGPDGVDQLAPLSRAFAQVYAMLRPERLLVLGCATGNGFEHVDPAVTRRVVGVDLQPEYLEIARARHRRLGGALELVCRKAEDCSFEPGAFDLVFAALFFEWVDPARMLAAVSTWVAPGGMVCGIVQLASAGHAPVSSTAYASVQCLREAMHLVSPRTLEALATENSLLPVRSWPIPVARGKMLQGMLMRRRS